MLVYSLKFLLKHLAFFLRSFYVSVNLSQSSLILLSFIHFSQSSLILLFVTSCISLDFENPDFLLGFLELVNNPLNVAPLVNHILLNFCYLLIPFSFHLLLTLNQLSHISLKLLMQYIMLFFLSF